MAQNFFDRLRDYYLDVAKVLRGEAAAASIFANTSDIGLAREKVYLEFLKQLGGFLFDDEGAESKQIDIIVTTDTTPKFDFHNQDGSGKSFSPVEGTLGIASIKSSLDKDQLFDALAGIASIPPTKSLDGRLSLGVQITGYDDWPYKIVYSSDGLKGATILEHLKTYYDQHPEIPISRRPNIIHVAGKYVIVRAMKGMKINKPGMEEITPEIGTFAYLDRDADLQAILWVLHSLQQKASHSAEISYNYLHYMKKIHGL